MDKLRSIGKHYGECVLGYDGKDLQKRNVFSLEWKSEGVIDVVSRWNLWRNHRGRGGFGGISHTHPFNGPFSGTTRVSRYQKGKTNLDFTKARESEWQWHQLGHMQVCTLLQTDNHTSTPPLITFYRPDALPATQPTASKHWRKACTGGISQSIVKYREYHACGQYSQPYSVGGSSDVAFCCQNCSKLFKFVGM